jgi:hypothetical protein
MPIHAMSVSWLDARWYIIDVGQAAGGLVITGIDTFS